jgi:hypothetical protein
MRGFPNFFTIYWNFWIEKSFGNKSLLFYLQINVNFTFEFLVISFKFKFSSYKYFSYSHLSQFSAETRKCEK